MKIQQIFEQIEQSYRKMQSRNIFKHDLAHRMINKHIDSPKSGRYGRVYFNGDPHTVNKINYEATKENDDGYMIYMKYLIDNKIAQTNPFAPRVYKMDVIEDAKGQAKYKIQLETLHGFRDVSLEIIESLLENLYDEIAISIARKKTIDMLRESPPDLLAKAVELTARGTIRSVDANLNNLCDAIKKLCAKNNGEIDLHRSNIMYRLGKVPQLVVVDPIANNHED